MNNNELVIEVKNIIKDKDFKTLYKMMGGFEAIINKYKKYVKNNNEKEIIEMFNILINILEIFIEEYELCVKDKN